MFLDALRKGRQSQCKIDYEFTEDNRANDQGRGYNFTEHWAHNFHFCNWSKWLLDLPAMEALPGGPRVLEIGVFEGRTSTWLLENLPSARYLGVEPFPNSNLRVNLNAVTRNVPGSSIVMVEAPASKALPDLITEGHKFDLVYVDGDHSEGGALWDAMLGWELLAVGGIMIFDDYFDWELPDEMEKKLGTVRKGCDSFVNARREDMRILWRWDQLAVRKLKEPGTTPW
ncbi:hypothetical protein TrCOL_g9684 [Triparma columacea]|uniref:Class I SAM-dependent methyltransferase n=1 Tax=Triparma columacea TaxID=722753 RepID=A0A9W7GFW4_9STRA|nr:hypothetical protein TrCOL_g9684 [Triparma columacea]